MLLVMQTQESARGHGTHAFYGRFKEAWMIEGGLASMFPKAPLDRILHALSETGEAERIAGASAFDL